MKSVTWDPLYPRVGVSISGGFQAFVAPPECQDVFPWVSEATRRAPNHLVTVSDHQNQPVTTTVIIQPKSLLRSN